MGSFGWDGDVINFMFGRLRFDVKNTALLSDDGVCSLTIVDGRGYIVFIVLASVTCIWENVSAPFL